MCLKIVRCRIKEHRRLPARRTVIGVQALGHRLLEPVTVGEMRQRVDIGIRFEFLEQHRIVEAHRDGRHEEVEQLTMHIVQRVLASGTYTAKAPDAGVAK